MLVYHGTTADHLTAIIQHGLRSRGEDRGHWEKYPSRTDCVYLTTSYPFFFAMAIQVPDIQRLVIEIDTDRLDQSLLLPDEDFIVQGIVNSRHPEDSQAVSLDEIHDDVRDNLQHFIAQDVDGKSFGVGILEDDQTWDGPMAWEVSVKYLTTCCYRGIIPPTAFTRYCLFDYTQRPFVTAMAYNEGTHLSGPHQHHRNLTAWFFGDRKKLPRFIPEKFAESADGTELGAYLRNPDWKREEKWRLGIEVVAF